MRTLLFGLFGGTLLIIGLAVGIGGLGLQLTHPCSSAYQLSLKPPNSTAKPPNQTSSFESLTEYQQSAVKAVLKNRTNRWFTQRDSLEPLTEVVILKRYDCYIAELITNRCESPYDELAIGGLIGATIGFFLVLYSLFCWRME